MPDPSPASARLLVLDLDGTVLVGDEPVREYRRALGNRVVLPPEADAALEAYLAGGGDEADGYAVVAGLAARAGATDEDRGGAYAASRAALHTGEVPVAAAEGLADALLARPAGVVCALVTNAPADGLVPLLDRLGLHGCFDRVVGDAGKPAGMPAVLEGLLAATGVPSQRLLAVGDVWANDLAAAAVLGGTTALVDRWGRGGGSPDLRAPTLTALLPALARWWA